MIDKHEAKIIANAVIEALKTEHSEFWIDPKTHYDCHQAFNRWVEFFDKCKEDFSKYFRGSLFVGVGALVVYGIYTAATINT